MFNVTECGRTECEDRTSDLRIGDDLDAEDVCEAWTAVISKGAEDEILAFLIENEDSGEHLAVLAVVVPRWFVKLML